LTGVIEATLAKASAVVYSTKELYRRERKYLKNICHLRRVDLNGFVFAGHFTGSGNHWVNVLLEAVARSFL